MKRSAKIVVHSRGMGAPSAEVVRQRATELARIDGRAVANEFDWQHAKLELRGGHAFTGFDGDGEVVGSNSHGFTVGSAGRHAEWHSPDSYENLGEELIAEGMDEAVHEQMLAAADSADEDLA